MNDIKQKYFFVSYFCENNSKNSYGYIFYYSKFETFNIPEFLNQVNSNNAIILNYKEISKEEFENLNKK